VPPEEHIVPRFAAEPPQAVTPQGPWAQRLQAEFLQACLRIDAEGEPLGDPGEIAWYPDRTWHGRTFVPATAMTSNGFELFGYVSYLHGDDDEEPSEFHAEADFTAETAEANPDWEIDLCDEVIGAWRGEDGEGADMTLVWGRPLVDGAVIATAELGDVVVDQCEIAEGGFTLIAPDDYRGETLDVKLFAGDGREVARESLYEDDGEDEDEDDDE
jgi:hypothetical protein